MEDEQKDLSTPSRSRYKLYKILTLSLFIVVLFVLVGYVGVETTSSSGFCSSCHEMKPEAETWKASSHNEVACKECHIQSGVVNYAKAKANGLLQVYAKATNSYDAPIQMPKEIPNATCEKCHDMKTRNVTSSGDIIIPHDKHLNKDIKCVTCHSGVAHAKVSERNVTFKTDYDKWNDSLGKNMMSNVKFSRPTMEECIKCHEAREVTVECKSCHSTGMKPKSHDAPDFNTAAHGPQAEKDVKKCDSCHKYMTGDEVKELTTTSASQQFLSNGTVTDQTVSAQNYAKDNTFCQKCHSTRPASHVKGFANSHGSLATADKQKCIACHEENNISSSTITSTGLVSNADPTTTTGKAPVCSSCHPAIHAGKTFKEGHPIDLTGVKKPSAKCYTCHSKPKCESCHKDEEVTKGKLNNES